MAQLVGRLNALQVQRLSKPGFYPDGAGLYLQVTGDGAKQVNKSWIFCFRLKGKRREMGLGSIKLFGLAQAREKAAECRRLVYDGRDPIEECKAKKARIALEAAKGMTFAQCAEKYVNAHKAGWRNDKHIAQWTSTIRTYAEPVFGTLSVQMIDTPLVLKVLEPIWATKSETAGRLRGRIEAILDWATVRGYRSGENPARWRGHLDKLLPARSRVRRVKHHAALAYSELPDFMAALQKQNGTAARALAFLILTAARTGEVIGARPAEIVNGIWIVPAERMKAGKEHRVPLPPAAARIAAEAAKSGQAYLFPSADPGKPLSNMAMLKLLQRMERGDLTAHGFRSTFRDWAAERTRHPPEVVEMALAHAVANKVEAAYRRGDLLEKRGALMSDWARFCINPDAERGKIVPIGKSGFREPPVRAEGGQDRA